MEAGQEMVLIFENLYEFACHQPNLADFQKGHLLHQLDFGRYHNLAGENLEESYSSYVLPSDTIASKYQCKMLCDELQGLKGFFALVCPSKCPPPVRGPRNFQELQLVCQRRSGRLFHENSF